MGELSQNKNLILIEQENENNQNEMNIEKYVERVKSGNVQIENYKIEKNVEQTMKKDFQKLHIQRKNWRNHNRNVIC
jgi:hypothetical protein